MDTIQKISFARSEPFAGDLQHLAQHFVTHGTVRFNGDKVVLSVFAINRQRRLDDGQWTASIPGATLQVREVSGRGAKGDNWIDVTCDFAAAAAA